MIAVDAVQVAIVQVVDVVAVSNRLVSTTLAVDVVMRFVRVVPVVAHLVPLPGSRRPVLWVAT